MPEIEGGNITVYTGPKGGKFILKKGKKVYVDKKSLNNPVLYSKGKKAKSKKA
jgi:hypothetical protein